MTSEPLVFPPHLYPAFAPLPPSMADHLLLQESRRYRRRRLSKRPSTQEMARTVLERISRARIVVYEYMHPFVQADIKRSQRGEGRTFPNPEWLLEALAQYAPRTVRNSEATLDDWQKRGLLRREKARGLLDVTSVAALLIARLAEGIHQRHWLPTMRAPEDPWWWCYSRVSPGAPIDAMPLPLPGDLPGSLVLWTPWQGAIWEREWQVLGNGSVYRWAGLPALADLLTWDEQLPAEIQRWRDHPLFGRPAVQGVLLEEARIMVLTDVAQKGRIYYDGLKG